MIRIVLSDDHPAIRSGVARLLEQAGDMRVVAEAGDADAGYAAFVEHEPDVLVTDLSMPDGGGLALIRRVLARSRSARILVFTMHDSALLVTRALDAGARGFLTKASAPDCLGDAVRALMAGQRYIGPGLPAQALNADPFPEADRLASLSTREFEAFRLLVQGHTVSDCATALKLSTKTIANQQTAIKEKLGLGTWPALVHLALRHGVI